MPKNDIILITDDDSELSISEGQKGWGEEVSRRITSLKEVRLNPTELEQKMADFLHIVGRLFRQAEEQSYQESGMRLSEVFSLAVLINIPMNLTHLSKESLRLPC